MPCRLTIGLLVSFLLPIGTLSAAPPPPPPAGAIEKATAIVVPPSEVGLAAYASLFTPDVSVFEGDKKVDESGDGFAVAMEGVGGQGLV